MPSALLQRITAATTTVTSTTTTMKHRSLPPPTILDFSLHALIPETLHRFHTHRTGPGQVCSAVVRRINAHTSAVWSVLRRFDNPLLYKPFLKTCHITSGDGDVGTLREVHVISGLPATWSTERLDIIDDDLHVIGFSVVGGDHRLRNYRSVITVHDDVIYGGTVVTESYTVDVPAGNTHEETCTFVDTILMCNLNSLAQVFAGDEKLERLI